MQLILIIDAEKNGILGNNLVLVYAEEKDAFFGTSSESRICFGTCLS